LSAPRPEQLTTTAMASDGRAVARRPSGQVVFVEGALPGEEVAVEVISERGRYASARATEVVDPSADRVRPPCPRVVEGCGGCQWQHVSIPAQIRLKAGMVEESLRRIGRVQPVEFRPTVELEPWSWRTSIHAGVVDGRPGYRRRRSHDLVDAAGCLIAHPLLAPLLTGGRYPGARSVLLRCGARTGERLAVPTPSGVTIDVPADVNRRAIHEMAAGRRWKLSAASFFQSRPDGADALADLVRSAAEEIGPPGHAVDTYSGVGLFAGVLAEMGWSVTAVEGSRAAVEDARANLSGFDATVVRADVATWRPRSADLVIADPSRAGLGKEAAAVLVGTGARRIVLVSCDAASLGRDAGLLTGAGYILSSVRPVDLFPHTWHVEVVSVFDRP